MANKDACSVQPLRPQSLQSATIANHFMYPNTSKPFPVSDTRGIQAPHPHANRMIPCWFRTCLFVWFFVCCGWLLYDFCVTFCIVEWFGRVLWPGVLWLYGLCAGVTVGGYCCIVYCCLPLA